MVNESAKALAAKAVVPIKRAASAAQVDRLVMAFLPGKFEDDSLSKKAPLMWEKLFPTFVAPIVHGGKAAIAGVSAQSAAGADAAAGSADP
jgi:hypothetical protein